MKIDLSQSLGYSLNPRRVTCPKCGRYVDVERRWNPKDPTIARHSYTHLTARQEGQLCLGEGIKISSDEVEG